MAKPSGEAMRGLARLEALIGQRAWDDVASAANELLSAPADGWVARGPNHYIGLREAVQRRLAAMPAEGLAVYRRRSDPLADDWLRRGREQRDERLLHRVVDEAFCTSAGDDALWALGEIALEQGEHQAARATWARVQPATAGEQLAYPDSSIPLSMVRARLALAAIRAGDFAQARQEIDVIQREHPQARGRLGGEEVELVERLAGELAGALAASAAETGAADWPTLFGSDRRRNVSDAAAPADAAWQRVWSIRLATPQTGAKAPPSSLPVVADGVAYVQDGGAIRAVRADDGSGAVASGRPLATLAARDQDAGPALMTIADGRLFAVAPALGRVAGYDLRREGALVFDHSAAGEGATLAGPPIVAGQRVIVCEITGGDSAAASIACYELWTGAAAWRRSLGWAFAADELQASAPSEAALSADGGAVYVNTGLGMVAALRAADGQPLWLRTYQRVERGRARMPNPCRLQRATAIVAPGDAQELFALDAASGAVRWSAAPPSPAARLLALDDDWLLLGGDRLCRLDIDTGRLDAQWGRDVEPAAGEGTVAGALVFWPTMLDVMLIDRQTGQPTGESLPLGSPGGANLLVVESNAAGSGSRARLLAAGPEQATAYGR